MGRITLVQEKPFGDMDITKVDRQDSGESFSEEELKELAAFD